MQIPALWTDLAQEQITLGRGYVLGVFFAAQGDLLDSYRFSIMVCQNALIHCGQCNCPIGINHNYLGDRNGNLAPMCFDCAEEIYLKEIVESDEEPICASPPEFLKPYREVKY